jgi:hypothetical protein
MNNMWMSAASDYNILFVINSRNISSLQDRPVSPISYILYITKQEPLSIMGRFMNHVRRKMH